MERGHFRLLYRRSPGDSITAAQVVYARACERYGANAVRLDSYEQRSNPNDFSMQLRDGQIMPASTRSEALGTVPLAHMRYVFVAPERIEMARQWYGTDRETMLATTPAIEEQG